MTSNRLPLFAHNFFADHAKRTKLAITNEIMAQSPIYNPYHSMDLPPKDRARILEQFAVAIPRVKSKQANVLGNEYNM